MQPLLLERTISIGMVSRAPGVQVICGQESSHSSPNPHEQTLKQISEGRGGTHINPLFSYSHLFETVTLNTQNAPIPVTRIIVPEYLSLPLPMMCGGGALSPPQVAILAERKPEPA